MWQKKAESKISNPLAYIWPAYSSSSSVVVSCRTRFLAFALLGLTGHLFVRWEQCACKFRMDHLSAGQPFPESDSGQVIGQFRGCGQSLRTLR